MTERQVTRGDEPKATYEIRLHGASPEPLRRRFPTATVCTTRTETVLFRRVDEPAELDALIHQVVSLGLVLTEVHEVAAATPLGRAAARTNWWGGGAR